ncbi:MAG: hypothetical protein Q4G13_10140, partial [Moraxella sp.]|nr:hypothetical protein [Moraxella sp.]
MLLCTNYWIWRLFVAISFLILKNIRANMSNLVKNSTGTMIGESAFNSGFLRKLADAIDNKEISNYKIEQSASHTTITINSVDEQERMIISSQYIGDGYQSQTKEVIKKESPDQRLETVRQLREQGLT